MLIVDDEPLILRTLVGFLTGAGYEVGTAPNGMEGLTTFQQGAWDIVVTDRTMPVLDGEEMTVAIKALSPTTPVILMTGLLSDVEDLSRFQSILPKPFPLDRLLQVLDSYFPASTNASSANK